MSEQRTPPKRIVAANGSVKKPSLWQQIKEEFYVISFPDLGKSLWKNIVKPALWQLMDNAWANAGHLALFGQPKTNVRPSTVVNSIVSQQNAIRNTYSKGNNYRNIMENCPVCDRALLVDVMNAILSEIETYDKISVMTLSQILPVELCKFNVSHIDQNWGWTKAMGLNENCIVAVPGGFVLSLPEAVQLR